MGLVIKVALAVFCIVMVLYYFMQGKHPSEVVYADGAKLSFTLPQEWCAMDRDGGPNTVVIFKDNCFKAAFLKGDLTVMTINAIRSFNIDRKAFLSIQNCLNHKEPGAKGYKEDNTFYCERPANDKGLRITWAYKIIDNERMAISMLSARANEDYDAQLPIFKKTVNSYKLVEAK